MTALENLWYGNLHPVEEFLTDNKEYKGLLRIVAKNVRNLKILYPLNKQSCLKNTTPQQTK